MTEREDQNRDLEERLAAHPDNPVVSWDARKMATVNDFPSIFLIEQQDDVHSAKGGARVINDRRRFVSVVSFIKGSSGEAAPGELAAFQDSMRRCVYKDERRRIGTIGAFIREESASGTVFPPLGNNVVAQHVVFRIAYKEQISRLFA